MLEILDISKHQSTTPSLDGIDALIARATFGTVADERYAQHTAAARAKGIPAAAYHFGRSAQYVSIADQVATFLLVAKDADGLALDFEKDDYWDPVAQQTVHRTPMSVAEAREFVERVHAAGRRIGLYASTLYPYPEIGQDWRWVAEYRATVVAAGGPPIAWDLWQYTSSPLDHSRFRGTLAEFRTLMGAPASPIVVPAPAPPPAPAAAGLAWPSTFTGIFTQEHGPVPLTAEPAGYYQRDSQGSLKTYRTSFAGAQGSSAHVHQGADIRAYSGTPLLASESGVVETAATWGNGENYVIERVNPICRLYYGHLSKFALAAGSKVARGEVIGYAGCSGACLAPHLHFEVQILENAIWIRYNPLRFMGLVSHNPYTGAYVTGDLAGDPRIRPVGYVQGETMFEIARGSTFPQIAAIGQKALRVAPSDTAPIYHQITAAEDTFRTPYVGSVPGNEDWRIVVYAEPAEKYGLTGSPVLFGVYIRQRDIWKFEAAPVPDVEDADAVAKAVAELNARIDAAQEGAPS
jgi:murein DD-endopeptidase MepM/ murein hydrolase activator NlpD